MAHHSFHYQRRIRRHLRLVVRLNFHFVPVALPALLDLLALVFLLLLFLLLARSGLVDLFLLQDRPGLGDLLALMDPRGPASLAPLEPSHQR